MPFLRCTKRIEEEKESSGKYICTSTRIDVIKVKEVKEKEDAQAHIQKKHFLFSIYLFTFSMLSPLHRCCLLGDNLLHRSTDNCQTGVYQKVPEKSETSFLPSIQCS